MIYSVSIITMLLREKGLITLVSLLQLSKVPISVAIHLEDSSARIIQCFPSLYEKNSVSS